MKNIKYILLLALLTFGVFSSCVDDTDELTGDAVTGGLVSLNTILVNYIVGNPDQTYTVTGNVLQSGVKTTQIKVYKTFESKGVQSDRALLTTVDVPTNTDYATFVVNTTFNELRSGLTFNGGPLPDSDTAFKIGDKWLLEYEAVTEEGNNNFNSSSQRTTVAISTRLAGVYTIQRGWYIHPSTAPGLAGDYSGAYDRIIESVDLTDNYAVYKSTTMGWGPAGGWDDPNCNFFYFYVSNTASADGTYAITIPKEYDGEMQTLWCSDELANCVDNPNELPDVSCDYYAILNDDGHDEIRLSYGYIRSSGTRQFDEILIKQ